MNLLFEMHHLHVTFVGSTDGVLDCGRRETLLEEAVHMAGQDCFQLLLLLEPCDEVQGRLVGLLLHLAVAPLLSFWIGLARIIL